MSRSLLIGIHAVRAALKHGADRIVSLQYDAERRDRRLRDLLGAAQHAGLKPVAVDRSVLDRVSDGGNHQGVVAEATVPAALDEKALKGLVSPLDASPLILALDGVTDPHNLGACLRSADGAGVTAVIAPRDRSCGLTPVACRVASGAAETVPFVQVTNLVRTLRWLQDEPRCFVFGLDGDAERSLYVADLRGPMVLVMGSEGEGLRRLTREACDELLHLPMAGQIESLNVSVATGISLYEAVRQRSLK